MKVFSTAALLFCVLSPNAFAQSIAFQQVGPLAYQHLKHSVPGASFWLATFTYDQPPVVNAATSQTNARLIGQVFKDSRSSASLRLWPSAYRSGSPAGSVVPPRFVYTNFDHGSRCFSGALEPFQAASCIGLPGFERPAISRLQNVAAHLMRHYHWQGNVGMNRTCVRSLSCSSVYEKSVLQRMTVRPPN